MKGSDGLNHGFNPRNRSTLKIVTIILLIIVILVHLCGTDLANSLSFDCHQKNKRSSNKKNVIFFVTDGMGPASLSLTRSFRQFSEDLPYGDILNLDKYLIGSSRTRSSNSLVTDSAAGATAFSCAVKSYNSAIGVDPEKNPCGTVLEGAKMKGYMTGLVVTTRITDATPAAFSSHVDYRSQEDLIAQQQLGEYPLGRSVDLMLGGGRTHFYSSNSDSEYGFGGSRTDGRNLIQEAQDAGWQYVGNRESFDSLQYGQNVSLPLLGLFADYDIPYDLDRSNSDYPSLEEEAITAINALTKATKDSDQGFFLLIEGSRIDHAGHQNDPSAQVREVLAFDRAFEAVVNLAKESDIETILISTSDHETGGLSVARQVTSSYPDYVWYPEILNEAKHSGEFLSKKLLEFRKEGHKDERAFISRELFEKGLGIKSYSHHDISSVMEATNMGGLNGIFNEMISTRARIGWSTTGHSAVDVNIYAYANRKDAWQDLLDNLQGNHENTEIGAYMEKILGIDLAEVTERVKNTEHSPKRMNAQGQPEFDTYHHRMSGIEF